MSEHDPASMPTPARPDEVHDDATQLRPPPSVAARAPQPSDAYEATQLRAPRASDKATPPPPVPDADATHLAPRPETPPIDPIDWTDFTQIRPARGQVEENVLTNLSAPRTYTGASLGGDWQIGGSASSPSTLPPAQAELGPAPWTQTPTTDWPANENRFVVPTEEAIAERAPLPWRRIIVGVASVLVLAIVTGWVYVQYLRPQHDDPKTRVHEASSNTSKEAVARPDEAVQKYLNALAEGNTSAALRLGQVGPGSTALIVSSVYQQSLRAAKIGNIHVTPAGPNDQTVKASYTVGNTPVNYNFTVVKQNDGSWLLSKTTITVQFESPHAENVPVVVNGQRVDQRKKYELLPGHYAMTTGLPFLQYASSDDLDVATLGYPELTNHQLSLELSPAGRTAFIDVGRRSLQACMAAKELSPHNCPNAAYDSGVIASTIKWTLTNNPWDGASPGLDPDDKTTGFVPLTIRTNFSAQIQGGGSSDNNPFTDPVRLSMDMTKASQEQLKPVWTRTG